MSAPVYSDINIAAYWVLLKGNIQTDAPTETKQPEEEIEVGNEDTKPNEDGEKSLVVYFSVPETTDPNKKMTTEVMEIYVLS